MQYEEVVKMIEESNRKVDEVLKAAKLQRVPKEPMSKEKLEMILAYITGIIGIMAGAFLLFSMFYFLMR